MPEIAAQLPLCGRPSRDVTRCDGTTAAPWPLTALHLRLLHPVRFRRSHCQSSCSSTFLTHTDTPLTQCSTSCPTSHSSRPFWPLLSRLSTTRVAGKTRAPYRLTRTAMCDSNAPMCRTPATPTPRISAWPRLRARWSSLASRSPTTAFSLQRLSSTGPLCGKNGFGNSCNWLYCGVCIGRADEKQDPVSGRRGSVR